MRRTMKPDLPATGASLRSELSARNLARAETFVHELSYTSTPSVLYSDADGCHGNFYPPAYRCILNHPQWRKRLQKAYTASARIPHRHARIRRELDTACSSDALLMNIFCAPAALQSKRLQSLLGIGPVAQLDFGVRTRLPLNGGYDDRTEADMVITSGDNGLIIEAKLTESNFQTGRAALLTRYYGFEDIFDTARLPRNARNDYLGYQLIRLILASHHHDARFLLFADARRPDLHEQAFRIFTAVRTADLRSRLHLVTWQEIVACVTKPLQRFLAEKYGILPK